MNSRIDIRLTQSEKVSLILLAERYLKEEDKSRMGRKDRSEVSALVRTIARGKLTPIRLPEDRPTRDRLELILRLFVDSEADMCDESKIGLFLSDLLGLIARGDLKLLPRGA